LISVKFPSFKHTNFLLQLSPLDVKEALHKYTVYVKVRWDLTLALVHHVGASSGELAPGSQVFLPL
jgi:hypothetical protein